MKVLTRSLEKLQESLETTRATPLSAAGPDASFCDDGCRLFTANETITMAKLHSLMLTSGGAYLTIADEIEGLLRSLDATGGPDAKDRRMWLALYNGCQWARSSQTGRRIIQNTRLNYTGKYTCCISLVGAFFSNLVGVYKFYSNGKLT